MLPTQPLVRPREPAAAPPPSRKIATGVEGFDDVTGGGLARGRVTVLFGGAGTGKTIFALQTLVTSARAGGVGLFVALEQSTRHLIADAAELEWDLSALRGRGIELIDAQLPASVIDGGAFDLVGLLAMLASKAKAVGAGLIVFDGLDVLLAHLGDPALARREVFRIREWLHEHDLTGIITAKLSAAAPRAQDDYLQYLADCVVELDHVLSAGTALRMLRVSKYRGSAHSANELAFTIGRTGIEVAGATSSELRHVVSSERITSGVERLDAMLGGGYYRCSSALISGAPGTAKSSLVSAFAAAACDRGEKTVYVSFDEAPQQIVRNMESIGVRLGPHVASGVLRICSLRTRAGSPEAHVARIRKLVQDHEPMHLVIDPISALAHVEKDGVADRAALQLLDLAKGRGITVVSTSLLASAAPLSEETPVGISTVADTWMHVSYVSHGGERNRAISVIKSRGTRHSSQVRELVLADEGISLADVYSSGGEVLMGTARWERENQGRRDQERSRRHTALRGREADLALAAARARVETFRIEEQIRETEVDRVEAEGVLDDVLLATERTELVARRGGDTAPPTTPRKVRASRR